MEKLITRMLSIYLNALSRLSSKIAGKHAFFIFCYPFAAKLKAHQHDFLNTAEQIQLGFEGKNIAGYKWGQGKEVLLCLHGWQSNSFRWKKYVEELDKERFTILAIDAPGHGNSTGRILNVPIYARLIQHLIDRFEVDHLLCHSIGGFSAMHAIDEFELKGLQNVVIMGAPGNAEEFVGYFNQVVGLSSKAEAAMRAYFEAYTGYEVGHYAAVRFASSFECSGLIIHDIEDDEVPVQVARDLNAVWTNSQLFVTEGFGHKLRDISVVHRIQEFLDEDGARLQAEPSISHSRPSVLS